MPAPLEVWANYDVEAQSVTLAFVDPVSGLSTPIILNGFREPPWLDSTFALTPRGVLFRQTSDGRPVLAYPPNKLTPLPFIPQQAEGLTLLDWATSADGGKIAWVEVFPTSAGWLSQPYLANLDGSDLLSLPPLPFSTLDPLGRGKPLALSADGRQVLFDSAAPFETPFPTFRDVYLYEDGEYRPFSLPTTLGGLRGAFYPPLSAPLYAFEAGDGLGRWAAYDETRGALDVWLEQNPLPLRIWAFDAANDLLILGDGAGATYKLERGGGLFQRVSDSLWLGRLTR
jgi:hypothetical protein